MTKRLLRLSNNLSYCIELQARSIKEILSNSGVIVITDNQPIKGISRQRIVFN